MVDDKRTAPPNRSPRRDPYRLSGEIFNGRYRIEQYAGMGSFGAVYRATNLKVGSTVAIKILKPDLGDDEAAGARLMFHREALTAGSLSHPHIVAVTDVDEDHGFAYLVMEWLEGRTLEDELRARAPLSPEETAPLLAQMAEALECAHGAGVIHRDIKPSNVHLGSLNRPFVKMIDFGIAKVITSTMDAVASRIAGTLAYMSPEQISGGRIDQRSDIYSLGIMLYQMLTGELPFKGDSRGHLIQQHLVEPPPPLFEARSGLSPALSRVIERALSKLPEERQQSVQELHYEFAAALKHPYAPPVPVPPRPFPPIPYTDPPRDAKTEKLPRRETDDKPRPPSALYYALNGAFTLFSISFLYWLSHVRTPDETYDFLVPLRNALVFVALRDALLGALCGILLAEWRQGSVRWSVARGRRLKSLIVYGATGLAIGLIATMLGSAVKVGGVLGGNFNFGRLFYSDESLRANYSYMPLQLVLAATGLFLGIFVWVIRVGRPAPTFDNSLAQAETEVHGGQRTTYRYTLGGAIIAFILSFLFWLMMRATSLGGQVAFPVVIYDALLGALLGFVLHKLLFNKNSFTPGKLTAERLLLYGATAVLVMSLLYRLRGLLSSGPLVYLRSYFLISQDYLIWRLRLFSVAFLVGSVIYSALVLARKKKRYKLTYTLAGICSALLLSLMAWRYAELAYVSGTYYLTAVALSLALLGVSLAEFHSPARWSVATGYRGRAFIIHGLAVAAILTCLVWLYDWMTMALPSLWLFDPSYPPYKNTMMMETTFILAGIGFIAGLIVCALRIGFRARRAIAETRVELRK